MKLNVLVEPGDTVVPVCTEVEPIVPVPCVPEVTEPESEHRKETSG